MPVDICAAGAVEAVAVAPLESSAVQLGDLLQNTIFLRVGCGGLGCGKHAGQQKECQSQREDPKDLLVHKECSFPYGNQ